jgi:transposase
MFARIAEHAELRLVIEPLPAAWRVLDDQVDALERRLIRRARRHEVCQRLITVPGVGPLTALVSVRHRGRRSRAHSTVIECGAYLA